MRGWRWLLNSLQDAASHALLQLLGLFDHPMNAQQKTAVGFAEGGFLCRMGRGDSRNPS
jgi:hypothetical protein